MSSLAASDPALLGANWTPMVQVDPAAKVPLQGLEIWKLPGLMPPMSTLEITRGSVPLLVTSIVCSLLVVPTSALPKSSPAGENVTGPMAAPAAVMPETARATSRNAISGSRLMASADDDVAALWPSRTAAPTSDQ